MSKCEHDWHYISHWKLLGDTMVRRVCKICDERQVASIPKEVWEIEEGRLELSD